MFKFCPNCGKQKTPSWKFCPYCGYEFEEIGLAGEAAEPASDATISDALLGQIGQKQTEYKLRIMILRGMYAEAEAFCNELIQINPTDRVGRIGLVRIASKNYREFEGAEIEQRINAVHEALGNAAEFSDSEYSRYIAAPLTAWLRTGV